MNIYENIKEQTIPLIKFHLSKKGELTEADIRNIIKRVINNYSEYEEHFHFEETDRLVKEMENIFSTTITIQEPRVIKDNSDHKEWLNQKRDKITWNYWLRYKNYLVKTGKPIKTIESIDSLTDRILALIEDPQRTDSWDRRGMVVGNVQSGKTANYIGLISKAVDAGYRMIIVLAGMHNNLRSQTQIRLDEGFLGYDSTPPELGNTVMKHVGVGFFSELHTNTITNRTERGDFNKKAANSVYNISPELRPYLFVVKKNASVLKHLHEWLSSKDRNIPLLLIDDEADHCSINTKTITQEDIPVDENGKIADDFDPSKINGLIRKILLHFQKKAYIGYTATPFANIFIFDQGYHPSFGDDLFPRSFIFNMPADSNYIGPATVFGLASDSDRKRMPIIRIIEKEEEAIWIPPKHKKDFKPFYSPESDLPPSLRKAILSFILVCAARCARNQINVFNSMLVHVSRFQEVQKYVAKQIKDETNGIKYRIINNDDSVIDELHNLWLNDFTPTSTELNFSVSAWEDIKKYLKKVSEKIEIRLINGTSQDVLNYSNDSFENIIAVGGDRLSRGLTLECLSVSYFLRASKMYDTLMQMGRWFGYRIGYSDLCRLYITEELSEWFSHIADSTEKLKDEFEYMDLLGKTPADYGLKVKSHPELMITSAVKMKSGTELSLSFAGEMVETLAFYRDNENVLHNKTVFEKTISEIISLGYKMVKDPYAERNGKTRKWDGSYCFYDIPKQIIVDFLKEYKAHPNMRKTSENTLIKYIEGNNLLKTFTILIRGGDQGCYRLPNEEKDIMKMVQRDWRDGDNNRKNEMFNIKRIATQGDESIDITNEQYNQALEMTIKLREEKTGKRESLTDPSGIALRQFRDPHNALIAFYLLDPKPDKTEYAENGDYTIPIVGFALSFPGQDSGNKVSYFVNNVYYRQEMGTEE